MEKSTISIHEARAFMAFKDNRNWITSPQLAESAGIADRTARAHASKLVKLGIVDQSSVSPGFRYRISENAGQRNFAYLNRLESACVVFGLAKTTPLTSEAAIKCATDGAKSLFGKD